MLACLKWVSKEILVNAARKVGVTTTTLSVDMMQKDKFERAADIMDQSEVEPSTSTSILLMPTPGSAILIVSPDKRCGSAQCWEEKFNQTMLGIIDELHEKSIQLQEIPGFMIIQKVKPKLSKKNTQVTQAHGSMKAKKVLDMLKDVEDRKLCKRSIP